MTEPTPEVPCAENGHMTARRSHETAWGEPASPLAPSPDFCFRCGGTDVSFDWRAKLGEGRRSFGAV